MRFAPDIRVYDVISPTDNWPHKAMQFIVGGTYGAGLTIILTQGYNQVFVECVEGDTPISVAGKIVASWNIYNPDPLNKVGPVNDVLNVINPMQPRADVIQLVSPTGRYEPFIFNFEEHQVVVPVIKKNDSNWWWWLLIAGGLYAATRKKNRRGAR